ncbi:polysaccharide deacetylase family protein [Paenibacillus tuaregi]|uniref:polysaccharide deacetylase family protein n=1 Tax=Paenibacillus tuaregi TaxID=1816681 RepID=UPI000838C19B|nr:polysaccharide deacetylase family protein [Paenibacillus tuaregi]
MKKIKWISAAVIVLVLVLTANSLWQNGSSKHKINNLTPLSTIGDIGASIGAGKGSDKPVNVKSSKTTPSQATPNKIYYRNKVIVLMYHEVTPEQIDSGTVLVSKFKRQIELMKANGFKWITMKEYSDFILKGTPVPPNAVLMTFDDGYESFYEYAYPVLKEHKIPATMFLIANTVDNPKHPGIPKLTWAQVDEMHKNGIDFYNHTYDSHILAPTSASHKSSRAVLAGPMYLEKLNRKETMTEFKARVKKDLSQAQAILKQRLGNNMDVLAFPYGAYTKETLQVCRELGIKITFTVKPGINAKGQLNGFRVNAGGKQNNPDELIKLMKSGAKQETKKKLSSPFDLLHEGPFKTLEQLIEGDRTHNSDLVKLSGEQSASSAVGGAWGAHSHGEAA